MKELNKLNEPVLLIFFNRPHTLKRVFEKIKEAAPSKLYLACDGPREGKDDETKIRECQKIVENIDWECDVKKLYKEKNVGCNLGVTSAVSWLFDNEESGIILEDDCLPSISFFGFSKALLEKYKHDTRISVISGSNHLLGKFNIDSDYYYSHNTHIWGWASWRRTWENYTLEIKYWDEFNNSGFLEHSINSKPVIQVLKSIFNDARKGKINEGLTWDYRFVYHNWLNHQLSIIPAKNLVTNIGFDGSGSSGAKQDFVYAAMAQHYMAHESIKSPKTMIPFYTGDRFTYQCEFWRGSKLRMWKWYIIEKQPKPIRISIRWFMRTIRKLLRKRK